MNVPETTLQLGWVIMNTERKGYYVVIRKEADYVEVRFLRTKGTKPIILRWPPATDLLEGFIRVA